MAADIQSEGQSALQSLRADAIKCWQLFERCAKLNTRPQPATFDRCRQVISNQYSKFKLWSGNLGVFQGGHASLDWRLKDSRVLHEQVSSLLRDLKEDLEQCLEILNGIRVEYEDEEEEFEGEPGELETRSDAIIHTTKNLLGVSFLIRNQGSRQAALAKAQSYRSFDEDGVDQLGAYEQYDRIRIRDILHDLRRERHADGSSGNARTDHRPDGANVDDALLERLTKATSARRRQFAYWENHSRKLKYMAQVETFVDPVYVLSGEHANVEDTGTDRGCYRPATIYSDTNVSNVPVTTQEILQPIREADSMSEVSYATTTRDIDGNEAALPSPPQLNPDEEVFECNYCYVVCHRSEARRRRWRKHIIEDLQPYVCTYEKCSSGHLLFGSRHEWLAHERNAHRQGWVCRNHPGKIFESREAFKGHLQASDPGIDAEQVRALLELATIEKEDLRAQCPICLLEVAQLPQHQNLHKHLAQHLETFSLAALPSDIECEDIEESGSSTAEDSDSDEAQRASSDTVAVLDNAHAEDAPSLASETQQQDKAIDMLSDARIASPVDVEAVPSMEVPVFGNAAEDLNDGARYHANSSVAPGRILSTIVSILAILDAIVAVYKKVHNAERIPTAFQRIYAQIPLIRDTLAAAEDTLKSNPSQYASSAEQILNTCEQDAKNVHEMYRLVCDKIDSRLFSRYTISKMSNTSNGKVEEVWRRILESLRVLTEYQFFRDLPASPEKLPTAIEEIEEVEDAAPEQDVGVAYNSREQDSIDECLRALFITDPRIDHEKARRSAQDSLTALDRNDQALETFRWIESDEQFMHWRNAAAPALLLLTGEPGVGKTCMAAHIIDVLQREVSRRKLAYFFANHIRPEMSTADAVLRGLLWTLLKNDHSLVQHFEPVFKAKGPAFCESRRVLWSIFESIAVSSPVRITILIDGFDECDQSSRNYLLQELQSWINDSQQLQPNLKLAILSRPDQALTGLRAKDPWQKFLISMTPETMTAGLDRARAEDAPSPAIEDKQRQDAADMPDTRRPSLVSTEAVASKEWPVSEVQEQSVSTLLTSSPNNPTRLRDEVSDIGTLQNLAKSYADTGQWLKAIKTLERIVQVESKELAEEHPDLLTSQHELARAYRAAGQVPKAIELLEHVLQVQNKVLGAEHPELLASQHKLAVAYTTADQVSKAIELLEHVLQVQNKVLGEGHPELLASQHKLAVAYITADQVPKAIRLLEHVVQVENRVLGKEHPHQLASIRALAAAYLKDHEAGGVGQIDKAIQLLEHVVNVQARILPEDHLVRSGSEKELKAAYGQKALSGGGVTRGSGSL